MSTVDEKIQQTVATKCAETFNDHVDEFEARCNRLEAELGRELTDVESMSIATDTITYAKDESESLPELDLTILEYESLDEVVQIQIAQTALKGSVEVGLSRDGHRQFSLPNADTMTQLLAALQHAPVVLSQYHDVTEDSKIEFMLPPPIQSETQEVTH